MALVYLLDSNKSRFQGIVVFQMPSSKFQKKIQELNAFFLVGLELQKSSCTIHVAMQTCKYMVYKFVS